MKHRDAWEGTGMPLQNYPLTLEAGATYPASGEPMTIRYAPADDTWTAKIQFRTSDDDTGTPVLELEPTVAADGAIELLLTGEQTLTLTTVTAWGVQFTGPGGEPEVPALGGKVKVKPWVVR